MKNPGEIGPSLLQEYSLFPPDRGQGLYSMTWALTREIQIFPRLSVATPAGAAGREYW